MRLIVKYYTYSGTVTVPVVYESVEAFGAAFEAMCRSEQFSYEEFTLADQEWCAANHYEYGKYVSPRIMTVDEFFETVEK